MRAVIYARVSSDSQDVDLSISAQVRALREYAVKNGYEVVREFVDEAESGRTAARPAFREMIETGLVPTRDEGGNLSETVLSAKGLERAMLKEIDFWMF